MKCVFSTQDILRHGKYKHFAFSNSGKLTKVLTQPKQITFYLVTRVKIIASINLKSH